MTGELIRGSKKLNTSLNLVRQTASSSALRCQYGNLAHLERTIFLDEGGSGLHDGSLRLDCSLPTVGESMRLPS